MRPTHRAVTVVAATAGGLALLLNFHTTSGALNLATGEPAATTPTTTIRSPGAEPKTTTTAPPAAGGAGGSTSGGAAHTADGPVVENRYGPVQVRVTVQDGKIIDVQSLQLPSDRSRSRSISQQAGPLLRNEVLQAQSAKIHVVSGATFTSQGYAQSLQGALDKAAG